MGDNLKVHCYRQLLTELGKSHQRRADEKEPISAKAKYMIDADVSNKIRFRESVSVFVRIQRNKSRCEVPINLRCRRCQPAECRFDPCTKIQRERDRQLAKRDVEGFCFGKSVVGVSKGQTVAFPCDNKSSSPRLGHEFREMEVG